MQDLSLHILDIAENSIRAGATLVEIRLTAAPERDLLELDIIDNGSGMDEEMRRSVLSPFTTSRQERSVGLGLALLAQAAREAGGGCRVESSPGAGTRVLASFSHSHIDRKPIGDLGETFQTLATGNPEVDFVMELREGDEIQRLDTRELRGIRGNAVPSTGDRPEALRTDKCKGAETCLPRPR